MSKKSASASSSSSNKLSKAKIATVASAITLATITVIDDAADDATMYAPCVVYTVYVDTELRHHSSGRDWQILQNSKNPIDPGLYFLCSNITAANAPEIRADGEMYTLFLSRKQPLPEIGMCIYEPSEKNHPKLIQNAIANIMNNKAYIDKTMLATDTDNCKLRLLRRMVDGWETITVPNNNQTCKPVILNNSTAVGMYHSVVEFSNNSHSNLACATLLCDDKILGFGDLITDNNIYCTMALTTMHYLELLHKNAPGTPWRGLANLPIRLTEHCKPEVGFELPYHIVLTHHTSGERWYLAPSDIVVRIEEHEVSQGHICIEPLGVCPVSIAIAHLFTPETKISLFIQRDGVLNQIDTVLTSMHAGRLVNWSQLSVDLPKNVEMDGLHFAQISEERYNVIEDIWNFKAGYVRELLASNYGAKKTQPLFVLLPCRYENSKYSNNSPGKLLVDDGTGYVLCKADGIALTKISDFQNMFTQLKSGLVSHIELRGAKDTCLYIKRSRAGKWMVSEN